MLLGDISKKTKQKGKYSDCHYIIVSAMCVVLKQNVTKKSIQRYDTGIKITWSSRKAGNPQISWLCSHLLVLRQAAFTVCVSIWLPSRGAGENHLRLQAECQVGVVVSLGMVARRQLVLVLHKEISFTLDQELQTRRRAWEWIYIGGNKVTKLRQPRARFPQKTC